MEKINLIKEEIPIDYHCDCFLCQQFLGTIKKEDGTYYSKTERKKYYKYDGKHIAKTPFHGAAYAIENFTKKGDYVFDPTIGSGTTGVEAVKRDRNIVGIELEEDYYFVAEQNIMANTKDKKLVSLYNGDARMSFTFLNELSNKPFLQLVFNNPPYSGDVNQIEFGKQGINYSDKDKNLAFLKETDAYYKTISDIYKQAYDYLLPGGYFCIMVKDMMRNKQPYLLHYHLAFCLTYGNKINYQGMILLPHYPPTLFMNTYQKKHPEIKKIPRYQTMLVFKKEEE